MNTFLFPHVSLPCLSSILINIVSICQKLQSFGFLPLAQSVPLCSLSNYPCTFISLPNLSHFHLSPHKNFTLSPESLYWPSLWLLSLSPPFISSNSHYRSLKNLLKILLFASFSFYSVSTLPSKTFISILHHLIDSLQKVQPSFLNHKWISS